MSDPAPRDTRLFDAGASWATEASDRRGYGDALRDAVERAGAGETEVRRVLADRGWTAPDESVAVLLARVLDQLGARSADPYSTGDGSYPEPSADAADEAGPDVTGYIGAVRRGPQGHGVVRIDNAGANDWLMIGGARTASGEPLGGRYTDSNVEHWPVAGVVPGTPAAWMSGEPIPDRDDEGR